jgi:hypothetical protein
MMQLRANRYDAPVPPQLATPPPIKEAELLIIVQLFKIATPPDSAATAPPNHAEFPINKQLLRIPSKAPPPAPLAVLLVKIHPEITALLRSHHAPPPFCSNEAPVLWVPPFAKVNPISVALLVR